MLTHTRARFTIFAVAAAAFIAPAALAEDCNSNGVDDCDDIAAGMEDTNDNGLLDSCERAKGDLNLDGQVNGLDLGSLLLSWGPMPDPPGACSPVVPAWATLIEVAPDPAVVTSQALRDAITATGLAWRVRDTATQIEFLLVPPGSFTMGCSASQTYACSGSEVPVHQVTITQPYYMGRFEVTQAQWQARMGSNPAYHSGYADAPTRPVEQVSRNTIQGFLTATGMRLPTESEWEYAYRAGTTTAFHSMPGHPNGTNVDSQLGAIAWYDANAVGQTHAVGQKAGNRFGLHDMSGNVWEWVNDRYGLYPSSAVSDPQGPATGSTYVFRGGAWFYDSSDGCRSSRRVSNYPDYSNNLLGFRVVRTP